MAAAASVRAHDLLVWGATGFTGRLVSRHLAATYPIGLRWALAGRSREKLEALRKELSESHPSAASVPVLVADPADDSSLDAVVGSAKVVLTLAGPYALYGKPLVASALRCASHLCDLTGEPAFMAHTVAQDAAAKAAGVCLVNACGYDSVPWDLGAALALQALRDAGGLPPFRVDGLVGPTAGGFSGGTLASLLHGLDSGGEGSRGGVHSLVPGWQGQDRQPQLAPAYCAAACRWTMASIMASVNERVVLRSAALEPQRYGAEFDYRESSIAPGPITAAVGTAALAAALACLALRPTRALLARTLLPAPGQGPSEAARDAGHFSAFFVASEARPVAGAAPRRAQARVAIRNADPGYKATAIMCSEAALCLALQLEELPAAARVGGSLTPSVAFGEVLAARLRARGFALEARAMAAGETLIFGES